MNLGASPGDGYSDAPYLYIGPWGPERPGDTKFWNAPFGAALTRSDLTPEGDWMEAAVHFLHTGLHNAAGETD